MSRSNEGASPAVIGLVRQIPWHNPEEWTAERRAQWLSALEIVLDFVIPVSGDEASL